MKREEVESETNVDTSSNKRQTVQRVGDTGRSTGDVVAKKELPNACLGPGPPWDLRAACARNTLSLNSAVQEGMPSHYNDSASLAEGLLQQALQRTKETDMVFSLDDATMIGGHKGVLCLKSRVFRAMFEVGMKEDEEGVVKMPGVGSSTVRALLEWVYLGKCNSLNMLFCTACRGACMHVRLRSTGYARREEAVEAL